MPSLRATEHAYAVWHNQRHNTQAVYVEKWLPLLHAEKSVKERRVYTEDIKDIMKPTLDSIQTDLEAFAKARDWDQYHSPKNIAMALSVEAAELVEIFQWKTEAESAKLNEADQRAARHEIADVLLYLLTISRVLNIDILQAAQEKLQLNAQKYPVGKSKGNAKKYDQLDD